MYQRDSERYRERYGSYPASVHADKLYRTRENRRWCKDRGIRLNGVPLGRPPKEPEKHRARRKQIREDEGIRNAVEGRFGMAKRRYSLDRVMARLAESSQTVVGIVFLVMNLERWLLVPFLRFVKWFCSELRCPAVARRETASDRIGAAPTNIRITCPAGRTVSGCLGLITQPDYGRLLPAQVAIKCIRLRCHPHTILTQKGRNDNHPPHLTR